MPDALAALAVMEPVRCRDLDDFASRRGRVM